MNETVTRTMRIIIISLTCLLIGFGIGWQIKERSDRHVMPDDMKVMLDAAENQDRVDALRAIRVIEFIQSGEDQTAVQRLSEPIVDYYFLYAIAAGTNDERRVKLRTAIEQLASTNKIVADEIASHKENFEIRGKDGRPIPLNSN